MPVFLHGVTMTDLQAPGGLLNRKALAGSVGFEPTELSFSCFQDRCHKPLDQLPIVAGLSRLSPSCLTVSRSKLSEPRCVCRFAQARITVNLLVPDVGDLNSFSVGGWHPLPQALRPGNPHGDDATSDVYGFGMSFTMRTAETVSRLLESSALSFNSCMSASALRG